MTDCVSVRSESSRVKTGEALGTAVAETFFVASADRVNAAQSRTVHTELILTKMPLDPTSSAVRLQNNTPGFTSTPG